MARAWVLVAPWVLCCAGFAPAQTPQNDAQADAVLLRHAFEVEHPCEVTAVLRAVCPSCSWGAEGREGAALRILVDGRYSQHVMLSRGGAADYPISLGGFEPGRHALTVEFDRMLSAAHVGSVHVAIGELLQLSEKGTRDFTALSRAPILHARANTIGRFTDLPI